MGEQLVQLALCVQPSSHYNLGLLFGVAVVAYRLAREFCRDFHMSFGKAHGLEIEKSPIDVPRFSNCFE